MLNPGSVRAQASVGTYLKKIFLDSRLLEHIPPIRTKEIITHNNIEILLEKQYIVKSNIDSAVFQEKIIAIPEMNIYHKTLDKTILDGRTDKITPHR